ncbi:MAG: hypothetical protein PVH12_04635 [Candidatus Bathyarchaeota archaeon]
MELLQNMRELFKMLSRRKPTRIFCPGCGSQNIHLSNSLNYWLTPKKYICKDCGYIGPIVMELEETKGHTC